MTKLQTIANNPNKAFNLMITSNDLNNEFENRLVERFPVPADFADENAEQVETILKSMFFDGLI